MAGGSPKPGSGFEVGRCACAHFPGLKQVFPQTQRQLSEEEVGYRKAKKADTVKRNFISPKVLFVLHTEDS